LPFFIILDPPKFGVVQSTPSELVWVLTGLLLKTDKKVTGKINKIINNAAVNCIIALKFDTLVKYSSPEAAEL